MLIIKDFHQGQSSSPYVRNGAFARSQNLDVFSQSGIARINYLPVAATGTIDDLLISITRSSVSPTTFYAASNSNKAYVIGPTTNPVTISGLLESNPTSGKYVLHWKGYLLTFTTNNLKYFDTPNWTNLAGSPLFSQATIHNYLVSKNDGRVYFCDGRYISVLYETSGQNFTPSNVATFNDGNWSGTHQVFTLPEEYQALGLAELGRYLIIAAVNIDNNFSESKNPITAYFFWDRSASTVDQILELSEKRMTNLLGIGGTIFISGGDKGKIWKITESGLQFHNQIPFDYDNEKTIQIGGLGYPSMVWWQDMLLVGVSSSSGLYPAGIYGIKDNKIAHLFLTSEGFDGSTKNISIGSIYSYDEGTFFFGWKNITDGTIGLDRIITSGNRQISYSSYFESLFYPVGTRGGKKSFDKVEVQLARPLQTGEGVKIKWRKNINDSFTTLGTRDYATDGAMSSLEFAGIHNCENIQIRCELTCAASSQNTPYITEVRLI